MSGSITRPVAAMEVKAYDPVGATVRTFYYATHGFTTFPSDAPASQNFQGRLMYHPNITRTAFSDARVTGGATISVGEVTLANRDQELSFLCNYGMDGREVVVRIGQENAAYPASWTTWMKGTIEQPEIGPEVVSFRLRDRLAFLALPIQATRFAGTNSGTPLVGAEGVAGDIKDKVKPICYGRCRHVPAVLVNTEKRTYQVHDGVINAVDAVYDMATALTFSANYANLAALEAAVVPASNYATCIALGLFRLGSAPVGRVTADIRGSATGSYVNKAGEIINRILTERCGISSGDINAASFTTLNAAATQECGIYISEEMTSRDAIEKLLESVGAWLSTNRLGEWYIARLEAPSGAASFTLTENDVRTISRIATGDPTKGIPVWRVKLSYKRYWANYQRSDLAAAVTEANKAEFIQPVRTVTSSNAAVQTKHILSPTMDVATLMDSASDASTEAARRQVLHGDRRDLIKVEMPMTEQYSTIDLNSRVDLVMPYLDYTSGRSFRCVGVGSDGVNITLDLWG